MKKRIARILGADVIRTTSVLHRALLASVVCVLIILSAAAGRIDGGEIIVQSDNHDLSGVDSRFVVKNSKEDGKDAFEENSSKSILLQPPTTLSQIKNSSDAPVKVEGHSEQIEPNSQGIIAEVNQPSADNPPSRESIRAPASTISAAIIPASATRVDLSHFVGRYEVDPAAAENFILDITLENGQLWLKPSHATKRMLLRIAEMNISDIYSDFRFTVIQDSTGRIAGLRIDSWNSSAIARKLTLPQPSLKGNTVFRLAGHADAKIVAVAGSFNNWNQSQFLFSRVDGEWICKINLPPGKYEYKFIVDGNWLIDPRNSKTKHDERGNQNSVLIAE